MYGYGFTYSSKGNTGAISNNSRYFTTLDGSADYFTIPTVSLTSDYVLEVDFSTTSTSSQIFLGDDSITDYVALVSSGTRIDMRHNAAVVSSNVITSVSDGKLHTLKITRVSNNISFFMDGVAIGSASDSDNLDIGNIGKYSSGLYFDGVLANVKITDAGTLIRDYKINEDWSGTSTLIDYGSDGSDGTAISLSSSELFTLIGSDWVGSELWTHGNVSAVAATSGFVGSVSVTAVSGLRYKFSFDVANYVNGSTASYITVSGTNRTANGSYTDLINATGTSAGWDVATNPTTLDVENGSIKRILEAP